MCCRTVDGDCWACQISADAASLQGATWQSPLGIGTVAPAQGNFTTLNATTSTITTSNSTTSNITNLNATNVNVSSLSALALVATDALKNLISVNYTFDSNPTPNSVPIRDADGNLKANNFIANVTEIITASGTTTLTTASAQNILFKGTLNQNVKMPKANDFTASGATYELNNNSTGTISLFNFGSGSIGTIPAGGYVLVICVDISSANGVWDIHPHIQSNVTWGTSGAVIPGSINVTNTTNSTSTTTGAIVTAGGVGIAQNLNVGGTINGLTLPGTIVSSVNATVPSFMTIGGAPITSSGTLAFGLSGTALPVANGGTGLTNAGTNGQFLSTNGTLPLWKNLLPISGALQFISTPTTVSGNTTLTASQLLAGIIFQSGAGAGFTLTLPSATNIITILGSVTDTFVNVKLIQITASRTISYTAGTGMTITDARATNGATTQYILVQVTSGTTVTVTLSTT